MKNLLVLSVLLTLSVTSFSQELQKGNLIGMHTLTVNLDPDVTLNQFLDAFSSIYVTGIERSFPGWKAYLVKGRRGEHENKFGLIYIVKNEEARDMYYNADGSANEKGAAIVEKLQKEMDELSKLGTWATVYTDWVVQ